jgi:putative aldouronate transport system substrate-binding protein
MITFGEQGVHWAPSPAGPKLTAIGNKEIQPTYSFLTSAPSVIANPLSADFVRAYAAWQAKAAAAAFEPLFLGQNITQPSQYNGINKTVDDTALDVCRGRKSIADLKAVVDTWRKRGGDALRKVYTAALTS